MKRLLAPFLLLALPHSAHAQAIGINPPEVIAPGAHPLTLPAATFGFRIGEPVARVRAAMPRRVSLDTIAMQPSPLLAMDDTTRGIKLWLTPSDGVGIIAVSKRVAGSLLGVRVGDTRLIALARLGKPAEERPVGGIWTAGDRLLMVQWDPGSGQIVKITVAHAR